MASTTKSFFNIESERKLLNKRSKTNVTRGAYPMLHTANREAHLAHVNAAKNSFLFAKHVPVKNNSQVP